MQVKNLVISSGQPLYSWISARIEQGTATEQDVEFWEREISSGDRLPWETLPNGTVREIQITGNSSTSWKQVETKPTEGRNDNQFF